MCRAFPLICWLWVFLLLAHTPLAAESGERNIWIFLRDKVDEQGRVVQWHMGSQSHSIAEWDLPVRAEYIENVRQTGADIRTTSRWFNALSARVTPDQESALRTLPCVQSIGSVLKLQRPQPATLVGLPAGRLAQMSDYGVAFEQLAQAEVIPLHQLGYTGSGVRIAVLDNGFHYITHRAFGQRLNVIAQRDFVNGDDVVTDQVGQPRTGDETRSAQNLHGAQVLSIMAAYDPGRFIGVAPDAEYILAKTEENATELPVEEDRWVAGLEWAVGLGAQVVNSSLGYNIWDVGESYEYADLNGQTALTSIAAAMAVERGVVVVVAAGNEAGSAWHYITAPADAEGVITVGSVGISVDSERLPVIAGSSSRGPTADGRIKPDVVAPGQGVVVSDVRGGDYKRSSGTSFASPIVSGVCALLLQANPEWEPDDVLGALRSTALDLGEAGPDTVYGWGHIQAFSASGLRISTPGDTAALEPFPNPAYGQNMYFPLLLDGREEVRLSIFDVSGTMIFDRVWNMLSGSYVRSDNAPQWSIDSNVASGVYFYRLRSNSVDKSGSLAVIRR